jgi:hypothetical protein
MKSLIIQGNEEFDQDLTKKLNKISDQSEDGVRQKERLLKIIEICNKNKDYNDDWIRQLNFFSQNITKMIKDRK